MSTRWPRQMFGIDIIYMRDYVARKVVAVVTGGRGTWALLPDGRVATSDAEFFKRNYGPGSQGELHAAERLWRLGKIKKAHYDKLLKAWQDKRSADHKRSVAADLKHYAKEIGLALSKDQARFLDKLAT